MTKTARERVYVCPCGGDRYEPWSGWTTQGNTLTFSATMRCEVCHLPLAAARASSAAGSGGPTTGDAA